MPNEKHDVHNDSDIDITPMLDVVFIMLIFFIVTASFVKEQGLGVYHPPSTEPLAPASPPIVLEVEANNDILIQNRLVQPASIKATVVRLMAENPESQLVVRVHPKASTISMITAIDRLKSANVQLPPVSLTRT